MKKLLAILVLLAVCFGVKTGAEAVSGVCSIYRSWATGDQLTAPDLTTSFTTVGVTNDNPDCMASHSTSVSAMQTVRHPFSTGLNPDLTPIMTGEIQSLRGMILRLAQGQDSANSSQWYVPPMRFQNHSGGGVVAGDVVRADPGSPLANYVSGADEPGPRFITATHVATRGIIGVVLESIAHAAYGRVAFYGVHHIGVTGDVHVGAYLVTSSSTKLAQASRSHATTSSPPSGAFAVALHATAGPQGATTRHVRALLFGGATSAVPGLGEFYVTDFGARCDGTGDDTIAIQETLTRASHSVNLYTGSVGGVVHLPAGHCIISDQLIVDNGVVMKGRGVIATTLHWTTAIPIARPAVRLGASNGSVLSFGTRLEDLQLVGNHVVNIGVFSQSLNEKSGMIRTRLRGFRTHGIALLDASSSMFNTNYRMEEVEVWMSRQHGVPAGGIGAIGVYMESFSKQGGVWDNLTVTMDGLTPQSGILYGVFLKDIGTGTATFEARSLNSESSHAGLFLDTRAGAMVRGLTTSGAGSNTVLVIHSTGAVDVSGMLRSTGQFLVQNAQINHNVTALRLNNYRQNSVSPIQVYQDGADDQPNVMSNTSPNFRIYSSATSGGNSRSSLQFLDGNGDGWNIQFNADGTADPIIFSHIASTTVGNTMLELRDTGVMILRNGSVNNLKLGDQADRATTVGTNIFSIFDGTAPVGTLANGISLYSTAGELRVMDSGGTATLLSPHDKKTGEWIFYSKNTSTGQVLRIDVERMLRTLNSLFGMDFIKDYWEAPGTGLAPTESIP